MDINNHPIVIVMIVAVLSALLAEIRIGVRIPPFFGKWFGMLIGPHILALAFRGWVLSLSIGFGIAALRAVPFFHPIYLCQFTREF
jgi:hypothetical protein